jgi:WD40 repeat protein
MMALITKAANWEKVYIFISSTFNDMHAERDYLVKNVFPELGEWCDRRKLRMVDIDLRWGVTEADATQNKNVVNVCLNRIDECRPFFLCFLGQRYGWVPERKDVSPETFQKFPGLEETMNRGASVTELEVLHSIISPFHSEQTIKKRRYNPSHFSFFYFRDETYLNDLPKELPYLRRIYSDSEEEDEHAREVLRGKKNVLNQRIANAQRPCHKYQARWSREHKTPEIAIPLQCPATLEENQIRWRREWLKCADVHVSGLDVEEEAAEAAKAREFNDRLTAGRLIDLECEGRELGDTVVEELKAAIQDRFPRHREREDPDELQREIDQQEQFVFINSEGFIKRTGDFDELDAYAESSSNKLFVLTAEAGMGKSTLLANWVDNYRTAIQDEPARSVHFRFIGASDGSTTVYSLLRLLLRELKEANDQIDDEIPDDPQKLRRAFPEFLKKTGQKWKTVIVLDALDQLELGLSDLDWLPRRLPDGIKLIVSFKRGEKDAENLYDSFAKDDRVQMAGVRPFKERKDQRKLIEAYLSQYLKELDQRHIDSLIDSEAAQNPLYLKVVLSELRVFGAFPNLGEKIRQDFGTNPVSAFNAVLARLERDPAYTTIPPSEAVPLLFGLLANARSGLTVEELAGIFTQTLDLEDTPQAREAAADAVYFFLRQTRPFLGRRDGRHDFFYKSFKTAARMRYEGETTTEFPGRRPARAWHGLLAHCFFSKADPAGDGSWSGSNPHGLSELPFHLAGAECWQDLKATLLNYRFLQAKVTALGPQPLIDDFDRTLKEGPGDDNLRSIRDVLRLSSASLAKDPDQLTGQLTGRLMGLDMPELEALVESAQRWAASPWLRPLTPSLERPGGPLQRTVQAHDDDIETVVVLPDGCRAVSGSKDCRLKLWDLETGRLLREHLLVGERKKVWRDHPSDAKTRDTWEVLALATSTDCRNLILGCGDSTARLWDVEAWREVRVFQGHSQPVYAVAFTPDGEFAITGSADKTLRVWRILTGEVIRVFEGHDSVVSSLAVTPDGRHVISGAEDKTIRIWELASGRQLVRLRGHQGLVRAVAVTPDGKYVLSGSDDCSIMVWDVCRAAASQQGRSPRAMRMLLGHTYPVVALAVDPGGRFAFSGATDCMLKVWDLEDWIEAATLRGHGGRVLALAPSADGRRLVSGDGLGRLCIWDLGRIDETQKGSGHFGPVLDLAVTPDGRLAVSASDDRTIRVWDAGNMTEVACLRGHDKGVFSVAVSPDSRHAVSGGRDNQLLIWDLRRGKRVRTVPIPGAFDEQHSGGPATTKENIVHQIDVTPDGRFAVTGLSDGSVRVWKLHDRLPWWLSLLRGVLRLQVERYRFQGHSGPVRTVAVTPDGRHLVSGADDKTIKLWSLQTGKEIRTLHEHSDSVSHVDVTHDGRFLVSSSWDASIILWDLDSGRCLHKLKGHGRLVRQVKTTPSGRHALSASADGSAILWNLAEAEAEARFTGDTQLTACAAFPDNSTFIVGDQAGGVHFLRAEGITGDHHDYYREAQSPEHRPHKPPPVRLPAVPMLNWSGVISMAIPAMLAMLLNFYTAVYSDRLLRWAFSRLPLIAGTRWVFFAISVAWLLAYLVIGAQYSIESNYSAAGFWVAPWTGYTLKWRAIFLGWPLNFLVPWGLSIGAAWIAHERWDMPFGILALALFGVLTLIWVRAYVRALV